MKIKTKKSEPDVYLNFENSSNKSAIMIRVRFNVDIFNSTSLKAHHLDNQQLKWMHLLILSPKNNRTNAAITRVIVVRNFSYLL